MSSRKPPTLKIVLLGSSGVGKTSLINYWINGISSENKSSTPTVGANHQKKITEIDDKEVELFIWDTAGQEQFQALTPLYVRSAACAIICTSIIDADSFNTIDTWIHLIKDSCEKEPPLILCVNKVDLANDETMSNQKIEEMYESKFSNIFFASAVTGEGVEMLFMQSGRLGLNFSPSIQKIENPQQNQQKKEGCC